MRIFMVILRQKGKEVNKYGKEICKLRYGKL